MAGDEAGRTELAPDEADSVCHWLGVLLPEADIDYMILYEKSKYEKSPGGLHVGPDMLPMQRVYF